MHGDLQHMVLSTRAVHSDSPGVCNHATAERCTCLVPAFADVLGAFPICHMAAFVCIQLSCVSQCNTAVLSTLVQMKSTVYEKSGSVSAGFGSLCIVPQLLFPFLLSEAVMGMAFPLFVLMACESDPQAQYEQGMNRHADPGFARDAHIC